MSRVELELTDLTKVSVDIQLTFDTLDVILLLTTGGIGYLARAAYQHFDGKAARDVELQRRNLFTLIDEAKARGASGVIVRVSPEVAYYEPDGGAVTCREGSGYKELEITFER
jgi:hypothetical protein